jgi:hypothetical protein
MQLQQKWTVLQHVFHLLLSSAFFFSPPFPTLPTVGPTKMKLNKNKSCADQLAE